MANIPIKNPEEFISELRKLKTTDKNHADVFNALYEVLINNDAYLKKHTDAADSHMGDTETHVTQQDKDAWNAKAGTDIATQTANGMQSAADKKKLDGIATGAEVNQNAFSNINAGGTTIAANEKMATFTLAAGSNITVTGDNASKKITIDADKDGGNAATLQGHDASYFNKNILQHPPFFINGSNYSSYASAIIAMKKEGYQAGTIYASSYQPSDMPTGVTAAWSTVTWRSSCTNPIFSIELYLDRNPVVYKGSLVDGENNSTITWAKINDDGNAATLQGLSQNDFVRVSSTYGNVFFGNDLNNWKTSGIWACTGSTLNGAMTDGWANILVERTLDSKIKQTIWHWNDSNKDIYWRICRDGTWTEWRKDVVEKDGIVTVPTIQIKENLEFTNSGTEMRGITGTVGDNDFWRVVGGAVGTDLGYLEIATADNGDESIFVRQYDGKFTTLVRTLTLLDEYGDTSLPNNLNVASITNSALYQENGTEGHMISITSYAPSNKSMLWAW